MGLLSGLLGGGGVGNSASQTTTDVSNETTNITQGAQEGGTLINVAEGGQVDFTDAGAIEQAFDFAEGNQVFFNENFNTVTGLIETQNEQFFDSFNELNAAENSLIEKALESANETRNLAFDNIKATTGKIASIAQSSTGDIKPLVTNALIGVAVIVGIAFIVPKVFK